MCVYIYVCRSSETGEGNFYFTGKNCKDLFDLLQSLSQSGKTRSSQQPMTKAIPAENMDASTKLPYLELLAPSSAEGTSTCKLAQKPLVRSKQMCCMHKFLVSLWHSYSKSTLLKSLAICIYIYIYVIKNVSQTQLFRESKYPAWVTYLAGPNV